MSTFESFRCRRARKIGEVAHEEVFIDTVPPLTGPSFNTDFSALKVFSITSFFEILLQDLGLVQPRIGRKQRVTP
jgi:hypothetical protein